MANDVLDWDDLSEEDKQRAEELMREMNKIFDKYTKKDNDEKIPSDKV
jgi:hypothetical protein